MPSKRKRHSSTNSSLLEDRIKHTPLLVQQEAQGDIALKNQYACVYSPGMRYDQSRSENETSSDSSTSNHPKETFERQKRHKTREDRYEFKNKDNGGSEKHKKSRTKRGKKGHRKRAVKQAREDFMQNFSSKKIGQDRLTVGVNSLYGIVKRLTIFRSVQLVVSVYSQMDELLRLLNVADVSCYPNRSSRELL